MLRHPNDGRPPGGGPPPVLRRHDVDDRYAGSEEVARIADLVAEYTDLALRYLEARGTPRRRGMVLDLENPGTAQFLDRHTSPAMRRWRLAHVPRAKALLPVYRPELPYLPDPLSIPLREHERDWFRYTADGIGIRTRAAIMRDLLIDHATSTYDCRPVQWLSLACGAALPVLTAARSLLALDIPVEVAMADHDPDALALARRHADQLGCPAAFTRANILDPSGPVLGSRPAGGLDAIEILGLFEYLPDDDQAFEYNGVLRTAKAVAGAATLLRNAWAALRPGGLLVFGNMLPSHPQLDFTLHVGQWPHIRTRSVPEVSAVVHRAGLPSRALRAATAPDGVYAVYSLVKQRGTTDV